jgi:hypothetical protein
VWIELYLSGCAVKSASLPEFRKGAVAGSLSFDSLGAGYVVLDLGAYHSDPNLSLFQGAAHRLKSKAPGASIDRTEAEIYQKNLAR